MRPMIELSSFVNVIITSECNLSVKVQLKLFCLRDRRVKTHCVNLASLYGQPETNLFKLKKKLNCMPDEKNIKGNSLLKQKVIPLVPV